MKKIIFASVLIFIFTQFANSQNSINKEDIKIPVKRSYIGQVVYSNLHDLADEYGMKNLQFVKFENGKYIPVRFNEVKDISEVQVSQDVIVIFAVIGAVLVGLILLRALL